MSSLAEMLQYAQAQDAGKQGIYDSIGNFGEAVGKGFVGMQDRVQAQKDKELDRAGKYLDLQSKVASIQQSQLINDTLKSVTAADESNARSSAFQNLGAKATAGVDGLDSNTNAGKFDSTVTDPKALSKRGYTTEVGISDGKPYLKLKQEDKKVGTVDQLKAIHKYVHAQDPTDLATAFPGGDMPEWATKFMAQSSEMKAKQDAIQSQKDEADQQRLEKYATDRVTGIRGDRSLADAEQKRDAAITVYNRINEIKNSGADLTPTDYVDLIAMTYKARSGAAPDKETMQKMSQETAQGNLGKWYTWATGKTAPASSAEIVNNLQDIAKSSGFQADSLHEGYMKTHLLKPKGLSADRWDPIVQAGRGKSFAEATGASQESTGTGGQGKTVQRQGKDGQIYTYALNEKTGKYE